MRNIAIEPLAPDEAARLLGDANKQPLARMLPRVRRLFRLHSPAMPGLVCCGAEVALDEAMARAHGAATISASGRGLDLVGALSGCLGEATELLSQFENDGDVVTDPASHPRVATGWIGKATAEAKADLDWIFCREAISDAPALAPADLCLRRDPARRRLSPAGPLSAGCAAGPTPEAARLAALLELIERDAAALWWLGGSRPRALPRDADAARRANDLLERLRGPNDPARMTTLLDLTTDLGVPVIAAVSVEAGGHGLACGVAARPDPASSAAAAILEMGQMELAAALARMKRGKRGDAALNAIDRRNLARDAWDARACSLLSPMDDVGAGHRSRELAEKTLPGLLALLRARGVDVYFADHTRPAAGVPAIRALAPLLQPFTDAVATPRFSAMRARSGGPRVPPVSIY